jgi:hypothetical protein
MPYQLSREHPEGPCTVCQANANILKFDFRVGTVVDCSRCGDYEIDRVVADDFPLPLEDEKLKALARFLIRKLQRQGRAKLTKEFFASLKEKSLPNFAELCDNVLLWLTRHMDGHLGTRVYHSFEKNNSNILEEVGALDQVDGYWAIDALASEGLIKFEKISDGFASTMTPVGWRRVEELQRAHIGSRFAFFARKFVNADLDRVYSNCLTPAVRQTGYDLRTVTQKAGHIDAIIEDEIRRCRFLIADLSDANAGAYWEAGFAEGLRKPVIYICRETVQTHFDTDHRHTVRWDLANLSDTAKRLKAVIRNTLLGDANQND